MKLTVRSREKTKTIDCKRGENLLKALHENGFFITAYCGGKGTCKKCTVRFISNPPEPLKVEIEALKEKIDLGFRLACLHKIEQDTVIEIEESKPVFAEIRDRPCCDKDKPYIALDIGTTTIALAYIENKKVKNTLSMLNPQIPFGADVITRIAYSNSGGFDTLCFILQKAVIEAVEPFKQAKEMVVCANPTMLSFFLKINPKKIGEYPYTPPFTGSLTTEFKNIRVYIPPVVSAFVGSDITAALTLLPEDEDFLFVDIGTNCEFILKSKGEYFSSSVPAGPALEGTNIDYGTIAKEGAIYKVELDGELKVYTIGNKKPIGITGSGLISIISLLRKYEIISKDGRLVEPWETEAPLVLINRIKKDGFLVSDGVYLTQNSIRNFQLVKASLNAGVELLLKKTGAEKPRKVFVGGGFSRTLTKEEIKGSTLLSFGDEFVMLGNSAIRGGMRLFCESERERVETISEKISYIEIAEAEEFESLYIEKMDFDE